MSSYERLERTVGTLLHAGGLASTLLLLTGLLLRTILGPGGASLILLQIGLLVLMGTPMVRVMVSCVAFFRDRDWLFTFATLSVLVVLATSMLVALQRAGRL